MYVGLMGLRYYVDWIMVYGFKDPVKLRFKSSNTFKDQFCISSKLRD